MSKIVNEARIKNKLIVRIRELLEHRAFWLYLLVDEAEKRGLDPEEFASAAITARWSRHGRKPAAATRRSPDCATSPCAATTASAAALTHASSCPRPLRRAMTSAR